MHTHCDYLSKKCLKVEVSKVEIPLRVSVSVVCNVSQNEWALLVDEGYLFVDSQSGVQKIYVKIR